MKKILQKIFPALLLASLLNACEEEVAPQLPTLSPVEVSDIGVNNARLSGAITRSGNQEITEHGFVFSRSEGIASIDENSIRRGAIDRATPTPIGISAVLEGLEADAEYYVSAFVVTPAGEAFSDPVLFQTSVRVVPPRIETGNAEAGEKTATLSGVILEGGSHGISEYGIAWNRIGNPTTSDAKASVSGDVTEFPRSYTVEAGNLEPGITYHYRAYVVMNGLTTYGQNRTFQTRVSVVLPGIETGEAKAGENIATLLGKVTERGSHDISEYGVVWNTSENPTTGHFKAALSGNVTDFPREYSVDARNLNPGATYHYRAYVIMNGVTAYGANRTFTTATNDPSVTTGAASDITTSSARLAGRVDWPGSFPVTEIGIVWGRSNNPTLSDGKFSKNGSNAVFPHDYSFNLTGLSQNTTYYFRAYVVANGNIYYGSSKSFRTTAVVSATVQTLTNRILQPDSYTVNGRVTAGTYRITRYGFYYYDLAGPFDMQQAKAVYHSPTPPVSGTFNFFNKFPRVGCGTTVQYRAFAIDENGNIVYGNIVSFSTGICIN